MAVGISKSGMGNSGSGAGVSSPSGGTVKTGYQITSFSGIALGSAPVTISNTNLKFPNQFPASNIQIQFVLTDTTGGTAPVTVNSVESAIQQIAIIGSSGRTIWSAQGTFGELTRWQQILNDNQAYTASPSTSADTVTDQANPFTFLINLKHLVIDPSESPLQVNLLPNTLASRATTLNSMTSSITSLQLIADFVPVTGYAKTLYRTKAVSCSISSGYFDLGPNLDEKMLYSIAADYGADSKLNGANTFLLQDNGTALIPYTGYQQISTLQNSLPANSGGNANHISGFFPFQTLYKASVNGKDSIVLESNLSAAPTGGGQSNTINLYQAESYS